MKLQKETKTGASAKADPQGHRGNRHGRWYGDACGTAFALELVGERWSLLIVRELMLGGRRFSDLRAGLPGISAKVLTERLDGLEQAKIVRRRQLPPPAAAQVYELTEWGALAERAILELGRWAATSPDHDPMLPLSPASLILSFRTMFDARRAGGLATSGAIRIGAERFRVAVADGRLVAERGDLDHGAFVITAPLAMPIAAAAYGKVPFAELAGAGLSVDGDAEAAWRFLDCFILPDKVG